MYTPCSRCSTDFILNNVDAYCKNGKALHVLLGSFVSLRTLHSYCCLFHAAKLPWIKRIDMLGVRTAWINVFTPLSLIKTRLTWCVWALHTYCEVKRVQTSTTDCLWPSISHLLQLISSFLSLGEYFADPRVVSLFMLDSSQSCVQQQQQRQQQVL